MEQKNFTITTARFPNLGVTSLLQACGFALLFTTFTTAISAQVPAVLTTRCGDCHNSKLQSSGFSVESVDKIRAGGKKLGKAVIGGHPEQSLLLKLITGEAKPRMPIGGEPLTATEIADVTAWIKALPAEAAKPATVTWRWPYEKPARIEPPKVKDASGWVRNPIDQFVLAKLEAKGWAPAPKASAATLQRRLHLDMLGLPPERTEDKPESYEALVDRLLADPRYGERWGRHWLDLARYAETSGLEGDGTIGNAWRYRDWVIDAFNNNMPYDRFALLQIGGGDEHSKTRNNYQPDPQGLVPTGFLRLAPWDRSNLVAADVRQNYLSEVTTATSSVFLGLTMGCARCHDHKYDPIPQRDYYRLQAFFQATEAGRDLDVPYKDEQFSKLAADKVKEYEARLKDGPEKKELDAFEAELLVKLQNGRRERAKEQKDFTAADLRLEMRLKEPRIFTKDEVARYTELREDADRTGDAEEKAAFEKVETPMLAKLRKAYASGVDPAVRFTALTAVDVAGEAAAKYSGKSFFTLDEKNRHAELRSKLEIYQRRLGRWRGRVMGVSNVAGPPSGPDIAPTRILIRGDYRQPGEAVEPGFPTAIIGKNEPAQLDVDRYLQFVTRGRRITLAKWIASKENPLTARVWVNRVWQYHFGQGIVRTTSDFGVNGDRPSHPELLDWLANWFMDNNWDTKALHRLILQSATYQQAAENPTLRENPEDTDNRLLWKYNRRRLEAEVIRDGILQSSGRLSKERGGPSVFPPLPDDLADFARYGRTGGQMWEPNEKEEDARRRSVYIFQRRSLPLPMLASFDALPFAESCERRSSTTTPLQALSMLNGYLVNEEAENLAKRLHPGTRQQQIREVFQLVLQRKPDANELDKFATFDGPISAVARVLFNSNEFLYLE